MKHRIKKAIFTSVCSLFLGFYIPLSIYAGDNLSNSQETKCINIENVLFFDAFSTGNNKASFINCNEQTDLLFKKISKSSIFPKSGLILSVGGYRSFYTAIALASSGKMTPLGLITIDQSVKVIGRNYEIFKGYRLPNHRGIKGNKIQSLISSTMKYNAAIQLDITDATTFYPLIDFLNKYNKKISVVDLSNVMQVDVDPTSRVYPRKKHCEKFLDYLIENRVLIDESIIISNEVSVHDPDTADDKLYYGMYDPRPARVRWKHLMGNCWMNDCYPTRYTFSSLSEFLSH